MKSPITNDIFVSDGCNSFVFYGGIIDLVFLGFIMFSCVPALVKKCKRRSRRDFTAHRESISHNLTAHRDSISDAGTKENVELPSVQIAPAFARGAAGQARGSIMPNSEG
jgi:hypothetical protein